MALILLAGKIEEKACDGDGVIKSGEGAAFLTISAGEAC